MKPLRILFVTEYYPPHIGGVETFFYELRKRLIARGHHVDVITTAQAGALKEEKDAGGTIHRIIVPAKADRAGFTFLSIPKVLKIAGGADIIHSTLYAAAIPAWIASKIRGKTSVLSVHEVLGRDFAHVFGGSGFKTGLFTFIEKLILRFNFDHFVAVSKATQKKLSGAAGRKSSVIYHGVDDMFSPLTRDRNNDFEFLYFGRIASNKGIWFLLDALKEFYKEPRAKVKFKLLLTGSGIEFNRVKSIIAENGLDEFVSVENGVPRKELPAKIAAADAVVVPSLAEGFGFGAAEAMAMNVPVILSDAGSLPEIAHGKHLLFKSGDIKDLVCEMNSALRGDWNVAAKKDFSWEKAADNFEKLYRDLLEK